MRTYNGFPSEPPDRPTYLTIGSFDGLHRGHQALIGGMVEAAHAAGCEAGLVTFDPHPLAVLRPEVRVAYLTTPAEKAELAAGLGVDFVAVLPFTRQTAVTSAADFVQALRRQLGLRALWIGPDFALGRGREGNAARLAELGVDVGFDVQVLQPFDLDGEPVRSSRIRALLAEEGAAELAAQLLGRPYQVWGPVTRGAERGRTLNFPTANLAVPPGRVVPAFGIYACWAWRGMRGYPAAASIGVRPTFDNGEPKVEAYLLDFDENLYGETLGLSFLRRLRPEQKFPSASALIAQMQADVAATRALTANPADDAGVSGEGWQELRHTADRAVRVQGISLRQLFARAAQAMGSLQDADATRPATLARAVAVEAGSPVELIVVWLNRLLLEQALGREMYTRFVIHEISETGLRGVAYGYPGTPNHTEVKAVTYHDLAVTQTTEGWETTVTFDV